MNVSLIVATFGSIEWADRGYETARSVDAEGFDSVVQTHLNDGTLAEARNLSATGVDSDWLCFLDADDELEPGFLASMREALEEYEGGGRPYDQIRYRNPPSTANLLALLVPSLRRVHRDREEPAAIPDWERLLIDLNCAVVGTLVPRRLFLHVGGFRDWPVYEDWDLWLRCVRAGARIVPVRDAVYRANVEAGSRNVADRDVASRVYAEIRAEHADVEPGWWRSCKVEL